MNTLTWERPSHEITRREPPAAKIPTMAYDAGSAFRYVDPRGACMNMTYDTAPQPQNRPPPAATIPTMAYDAGSAIGLVNPLGVCVNMTYDTSPSSHKKPAELPASAAMKSHGPWQIVESVEVYQDPWIRVRKDNVIRPDGKPGTYSVVDLTPGVCVLAMDDENNIYLTEEFHYGVGRVTLEAVSGGIEPGEQPLETAVRELREELGIQAEEWTDFGTCDPLTGSLVSPTRLFLARRLTFGKHAQEGTEQIRCVRASLAEAVRKVMSSQITHGPSSVLILKVLARDLV
jgi:ADP-ribose pyrophosphatase